MSNDITLEQLEAFCAVCDAGSYTGAANSSGRERTSLHHFVTRLEASLGEALLTGGRQQSVTPAGEIALLQAREVLRLCREMKERISHSRPLRLTCYPSHVRQLSPSIADLLAQNSELEISYYRVSYSLRLGGGGHLVNGLLQHEIDLTIAPSDIGNEAITERLLCEWSMRVALPDQVAFSSLRTREAVKISELSGLRAAVAPKGHRSRQLFDLHNGTEPPILAIAFDSAETEVLVDIARASRDIVAFVPEDAFGSPAKTDIGPRLVAPDNSTVGGSYSLYTRAVGEPDSRSPLQAEIDTVAQALVAAYAVLPLRDPAKRLPQTRRPAQPSDSVDTTYCR